MIQWNRLHFGSLGISEHTSSNPGHGLNGDWASTRGNGFKMGGFSDRSSLGGLLYPIDSRKNPTLFK